MNQPQNPATNTKLVDKSLMPLPGKIGSARAAQLIKFAVSSEYLSRQQTSLYPHQLSSPRHLSETSRVNDAHLPSIGSPPRSDRQCQNTALAPGRAGAALTVQTTEEPAAAAKQTRRAVRLSGSRRPGLLRAVRPERGGALGTAGAGFRRTASRVRAGAAPGGASARQHQPGGTLHGEHGGPRAGPPAARGRLGRPREADRGGRAAGSGGGRRHSGEGARPGAGQAGSPCTAVSRPIGKRKFWNKGPKSKEGAGDIRQDE